MIKPSCAALFALFSLLAFAPSVHAEPDLDRKLSLLLLSHHGIPSRATLDRLGPGVRPALERMVIQTDLLPPQRYRALEALGRYADPEVQRLFIRMLSDPRSQSPIKHRLLGLLARRFGRSALPAIRPYLRHPDPALAWSARLAIKRVSLTRRDPSLKPPIHEAAGQRRE